MIVRVGSASCPATLRPHWRTAFDNVAPGHGRPRGAVADHTCRWMPWVVVSTPPCQRSGQLSNATPRERAPGQRQCRVDSHCRWQVLHARLQTSRAGRVSSTLDDVACRRLLEWRRITGRPSLATQALESVDARRVHPLVVFESNSV